MTYITYVTYATYMHFVAYMTCITYMTYINHNHISCMGYQNTHFLIWKIIFIKCMKN